MVVACDRHCKPSPTVVGSSNSKWEARESTRKGSPEAQDNPIDCPMMQILIELAVACDCHCKPPPTDAEAATQNEDLLQKLRPGLLPLNNEDSRKCGAVRNLLLEISITRKIGSHREYKKRKNPRRTCQPIFMSSIACFDLQLFICKGN
ncbi:hypothetical protein M9H77_31655 [Catharanthus roseus]|uniref:Uncharacterized protein n=1 Tax=Catharanthus roseus TaxID=4058 RepID=A0ACC0A314_CATRO|nr:hypothetical protein M9H77_31655 [Catharanthus roseus]